MRGTLGTLVHTMATDVGPRCGAAGPPAWGQGISPEASGITGEQCDNCITYGYKVLTNQIFFIIL